MPSSGTSSPPRHPEGPGRGPVPDPRSLTAPGRPPLLQARGLERTIAGRRLWGELRIDLLGGERLGLVAPSGAGKTLLLRTLGLLDPIERGSLHLLGRTPAAWGLPTWRSLVLYVAQRASVHPGPVESNLRGVWEFRAHRQRGGWNRERILGWLAELGREPAFLTLDAERLSGGERQLLALLRALQLDPMVLLLDEPTASLDAATTGRVEGVLRQWLAVGERACLLTSHDGSQIERFTTGRITLTP